MLKIYYIDDRLKFMNVLFVCRGNVGRSQIAEAFFKQLTENKHSAISAGTEALGSKGENLDGMLLRERESSKYVIECMKEVGIDISDNFINRLTTEMVKNADRIFVMVKPDTTPEFLKENSKVIYWDIKDPDEQPLEYYRRIRDQIKDFIEESIKDI